MNADDEPEVVSYLRDFPPFRAPKDCQVIESRTRVAVRSQFGHKLWHLYKKKRHARSAPLSAWTFDDLTPAKRGTTSEAQATKSVVEGKWGEP